MRDPGRALCLALTIGSSCSLAAHLQAGDLAGAASCPVITPGPVGFKSPVLDADLADWCLSAAGDDRIDDCAARLTCGHCSSFTNVACMDDADCWGAQSCLNLASRSETVWWDGRADAAVNDLALVAAAYDNDNFYMALKYWTAPDPASLPFLEIALDVGPGGIDTWHDPQPALTAPGRCNVSVDRACTSDADCHFCAVSTEPSPPPRVRACGSGCNFDDPDDFCDTSQTCEDLGTPGTVRHVGVFADPSSAPDYLIVFDPSRWLVGFEASGQLMKDESGSWTPVAEFAPVLNPSAGVEPPGSLELEIPWSAFGCTGCPDACDCPDFGPGRPARFTALIARGALTLDYTPDGAIEDVISEPVAGLATTSPDSCAGSGVANLFCEIDDGSTDAFFPPLVLESGGRIDGLRVERESRDPAPSLTLTWNASCSAADSDYAIYEGELGVWYEHRPVAGIHCSTLGATGATFEAGAGNRYYLVVPRDGNTEGSYGLDSANVERPIGVPACAAQNLADCP